MRSRARPRPRPSNADDRLIKMVAAIVLLAVAFWLYKQVSPSAPAPAPTAAATKPTYVPQLVPPQPALWGNTDGDPAPPEAQETLAQAVPAEVSAQQQAQDRLQLEQARLAQALAASNPQPTSYTIQPSAWEIRQARCQAAKDHREAVLQQVGLNRTYDLLRQLDDQVYEACKSG